MDINMPIMDGFTASIHIRQQSKYFPIVVFNGDDNIDRDNLLAIGIDDFIPKPCNADELHLKIKKWRNIQRRHLKQKMNKRLIVIVF